MIQLLASHMSASHSRSPFLLRLHMLMKLLVLNLVLVLFAAPASAELMGLLPGRSANIERQAYTSIEVGGGQYSNEVQWATARINFKPSHNLVVYADVARLAASDLPLVSSLNAGFDGIGFGGGLMFEVRDFFNAYDFAFKTAYHASSIDRGGELFFAAQTVSANIEQRQLTAGFVVSPIDPLLENGLTWYSSVGYVTTTTQTVLTGNATAVNALVRHKVKKGPSAGAGVVLPTRFGSLYSGAHVFADDLLIGGGLRFQFN